MFVAPMTSFAYLRSSAGFHVLLTLQKHNMQRLLGLCLAQTILCAKADWVRQKVDTCDSILSQNWLKWSMQPTEVFDHP